LELEGDDKLASLFAQLPNSLAHPIINATPVPVVDAIFKSVKAIIGS
jgi:hypothetical protein